VLNSVTGLRQWWDHIYADYLITTFQEKYSACEEFTLLQYLKFNLLHLTI